jgi:hypothetical protein
VKYVSYLCELDEELHEFSLLHVVVVEVVDDRGDESKVERLQRQKTSLDNVQEKFGKLTNTGHITMAETTLRKDRPKS